MDMRKCASAFSNSHSNVRYCNAAAVLVPQIVHETLDSEEDSPGATVTYYLDGAHTPESMLTCARWFVRAAGRDAPAPSSSSVSLKPPSQLRTQRVLVFNCTKVMPIVGHNVVQRDCLPDKKPHSIYQALLHQHSRMTPSRGHLCLSLMLTKS